MKRFLKGFFQRKVLAGCCNVEIPKAGIVSAFEQSTETTVPIKDGKTPYCYRCLEKMAIKCAWCGNPIFIGDPVTLYSPAKKDFEIPEYAVIYNKEL